MEASLAARIALVLVTCTGLVVSASCGDSTASPAAEGTTMASVGSSNATDGGSSGDDLRASSSTVPHDESGQLTTGDVDPCAGCEAWEACIDDACTPEHATCVTDERGTTTCTCDAGYYVNNGKCVDRILFALPMENQGGSLVSDVVGVDNDPAAGTSDLDCVSHDGSPFPSCYDDHDGTDFILTGGFDTMDDGSAGVFAAAEGDVVFVHDGEFDRCALNVATFAVECEDGGPVTPANRITIQHSDGTTTQYLHLMKDSILVAEGEHVACGELLARVGSSGNSSMPHLHFSVFDVDGNPLDPYAGPGSQPETFWVEQHGARGLPGAACQ